ncbi:MAG TPA: helix-turn-helix transcriptional regulator [Candidatus Binatia bacterium]|jgi:XRE family aerobic/anaerobic benzoate catabolism transcriptional regulator|nr:helix-turn-helix transcriptional regulator [Candidatus Binatia bacterium]
MATNINAQADSAAKTSAASCPDELSAADSRFLSAFGKRVRELRERRGLTRKLLAREANVSERYLGQLESGDGNVSIILLRRIASALNVTIGDIVTPEPEGSAEQRLIRRFLQQLPPHRLEDVVFRLTREFGHGEAVQRQRIALIGLRGAGKTTLGSMLAKDLQVSFIELDREIEQDTGLPLSELFTLYGQSGYRRIERRCLERVLKEHERAILAVGGGVVSEEETFTLLLAHCYTVWLKARPEEHMARVLAQGDLRPMAGNTEAMDDLKRILAAREPFYRRADSVVDTSGRTVAESFATLRQLLRA